MAGRYDQFCAIATALDTVGDRWTLLVVRELLAGPRRHGALARDLPGIATNMLADRLRRLEDDGLVEQVDGAGQDGRARTYRLTAAGRELEPVIAALARFGVTRLPDDSDGLAFRPAWLALAVRLLMRPDALDEDVVLRCESARGVAQLRLGPSGAVVDPDTAPDVVLRGDPGVLLAALRDPRRAVELADSGDLEVTGTPAARRRLTAALALPTPEETP